MCVNLFIISIDNTVLNLALPSIAAAFHATASQLQWIVDAYTLIFASLLITTGTLGDRFGRKRILTVGLGLFWVGSLGAALSTSAGMLIAFRALLGLAGAMIMPSTLSILIHVFRERAERAKAIAIWSSIFSIGAGIGPLIGGLLIHAFNWSAVFFLNLPVVVVGILGVTLITPESFDPEAPRPDLAGVLLSVTGLSALVFGMIRVGEAGWANLFVWVAFAVAAIFLVAFFWWEKHSVNPMLPLEFFKNRAFTGANAALTLSAFAMMGGMYFFSQYFQSVEGYSPVTAALCMLPMTPFVFTSTLISVRVNRMLGTRLTMCLGLVFSGMGLMLFSLIASLHTPYGWVLLVLFLLGSGIGFTMSPATASIMNSLPPNRAGIGSAMNDTTRQLGGALGVAVLGSLMNAIYRSQVEPVTRLAEVSPKLMEGIRGSVQSALLIAERLPETTAAVVMQTSRFAFVAGMREALLGAALAMLLGAVLGWMILPAGKNDKHSSGD